MAAGALLALADLDGGPEVLDIAESILAPAGTAIGGALTTLRRLVEALQQRWPALPIHIDLAELRGSYKPIPQTETAIALLREAVTGLGASEVVIFLDAPVSNSGRLKTKINEQSWPMPLRVELAHNPDAELVGLENVASSDSIVLDRCAGWFNLTAWILETQSLAPKLTRLIRLDQSRPE